MIDLRTLEIFYWVVQLGGFRRAAEKLHTTQPAVSSRIAALEVRLGVRLLDRNRRQRVVLTRRGAELLGYAERILALHDEMSAALADPAGLRGTVRLGTSETIVHTWLSALIRRVHEVHPSVTLDISVDISLNLREALVKGEVDVALLLGAVAAPRVRTLPLCEYPLAWIAAPGLPLGPDAPTLAQLARWPIITYSRATTPYLELAELLNQPGLPPARIFANSSLSSIVRMVLDGIGIGVIAPAAITRELASGALRRLDGAPPLAPLVFVASHAEMPGSGLAAAVSRLAQEVAQEVVQEAAP